MASTNTQVWKLILFDFFFTILGVLIVFRYAEFINAERFPLARRLRSFHKVKMKIQENHTEDVAELRNLFKK